jgi:hypothetical protein
VVVAIVGRKYYRRESPKKARQKLHLCPMPLVADGDARSS